MKKTTPSPSTLATITLILTFVLNIVDKRFFRGESTVLRGIIGFLIIFTIIMLILEFRQLFKKKENDKSL